MSDLALKKLNRRYRNNTNRIYRPAVLADNDGTIPDSQLPGNVFVRTLGSNGLSVGRSVSLGDANESLPYEPNTPVRLGKDRQNRDTILGTDARGYMAAGINPVAVLQRQQSSSTPQSNNETFRCVQTSPPSLTVGIKAWNPITDGVGYQFGGGQIDLTSGVPGTTDFNCYAVVALKNDFTTLEFATSTPRSIYDLPLNVDDENEALQGLSSGSVPSWAIVLTNGQTTITQANIDNDGLDLRNMPNLSTGQAGRISTGFTQTATVTVANTTSETALNGSGVGSLTLAANQLKAGKTLKIRVWGVLSSLIVAPGTLNIKIKLGSTVIIATGAVTLTVSLSGSVWQLDADITCRTTGATGTVMGQGAYRYISALADVVSAMSNGTSTITIDTTGTLAITVTATFGTASASNTISCTNLSVEILN